MSLPSKSTKANSTRWKRRKRELEELSRQQQFRPSDEVATFKVLKNIREIVGETASTVLSTEKEFLWVMHKEGLLVASMFGVNSC